MLASISPFGERARGQRWGTTVTAYFVASTLGGALVGGALGLVGAGITHLTGGASAARLGALAFLGVVGFAFDRNVAGLRLPGPTRQVDETWLGAYRGWVYGTGFGFQLGAAFTTIVAASITYLAFACAFLSASVTGGLLIGAAFGAARALPLLLNRRAHDPTALRDLLRRADAALPRARTAATTVQLLAVAAALVAALGGATA
jgi:hypothetical protein